MSVGMEMPYEVYQRNLHRQPQQQQQQQGMYYLASSSGCSPANWQPPHHSRQHWSGPFGRERQQLPAYQPSHHHVSYAHHAGLVPVFAAVPTWSNYGQPLYETAVNTQRMPYYDANGPYQQMMPYHPQQAPASYRAGATGNSHTWSTLRQSETAHNGKHLVPAQITAPIRAGAARRPPSSFEEYDHPSHLNPPHREDKKRQTSRLEAPVQLETRASSSVTPLLAAFNDNCSTGDLLATDYQLIPADATAVPPHPPIEKSGVPFAAFAAELLWEICEDARELAAAAASSPRDFAPVSAIGSERALRHSKMNSNSSLKSLLYGSTEVSPTSTVGPLTPVASGRSLDDVFHVRRHSFGKNEIIDCFSTPPPVKHVSIWNNDAAWPEASPETDRKRSLSRSRSTTQAASTEFKDYVANLLTVTLVTPQVLLLALHYAQAMPSDVIAHSYTADLAPFRLLLGCLIVANKHLDDNSFRCSTWAQVSALDIKEVVAAETFVLKAFHFEINIDSSVWLAFMHTLTERRARTNPTADDPVLGRLLNLVDTAAAWPY